MHIAPRFLLAVVLLGVLATGSSADDKYPTKPVTVIVPQAPGGANETRTRFLPDVPAMSETLPGFGTTPWYGIFAPGGTPKAIVARLHAETLKALNAKDLQDKLALQGAEVFSSTPDEFAALLKAELPKWATIVKESGAQID